MSTPKTVLITGASSGIGYAAAIEMARRGYSVYACARRVEPMEPLKAHGVQIFECDVSSLESVLAAKKFIGEKTGGRLDVLYNNAGQSCTFPAIDVTDEQALQCYQVNVLGPIRMCREFAPFLIATRGTIVFTGSIAGIVPFPWSSIYSSTKAAIHQFAAILHAEMKPFDVKVLNVVTGGVKTNIADDRPFPPGTVYECPELDDSLQERRVMAAKNNPMSAERYAQKVVDDIEGSGNPLNVYRGHMASILPTLVRLLPVSVVEYVLAMKFKLLPLWAALRKRQVQSKKA